MAPLHFPIDWSDHRVVADSMAEAQILIQILYIPMCSSAHNVSNSQPAEMDAGGRKVSAGDVYWKSGLQNIIQNSESLVTNGTSVVALLATFAVGFIVSFNIFRWSKEDGSVPAPKHGLPRSWRRLFCSARGKAMAARAPYATRSRPGSRRAATAFAFTTFEFFTGDGSVLDRADVYLKNGRL
jgi:hypothetical protein